MQGDYKKYIADVQSGKVNACKYVKLAIKRHLSDLKKRGKWPFCFDETQAEQALSFIRLLRHTKGEFGGQKFQLQDNQAFFFAMLFGWRNAETGRRRFTKVYKEVARKNGKSEEAAAVQLVCTLLEGERGAESYSAATTRDQAKIVFESAVSMVKSLQADAPEFFGKKLKVWRDSIVYEPLAAKIAALSADAGTLDGKNPHCAIIDEYHAHQTDAVKNVMQSGMGARPQPLLFIITTAGFHKDYPCFKDERRVAIDVLEGRSTQDDLLTLIYTLDEGDLWSDPKNWIKANPNIGAALRWDFMERTAAEAANFGGSKLTEFLTKNMNVWVDAPKTWIETEVWNANGGDIDLKSLEGRLCFGGLDLASTGDTNSLVLFFPAEQDGERHIVLPYFWLPESAVKKDTRRQFVEWARQGHLTLTPGETTDQDAIMLKVLECGRLYNLHSVQIDDWNSTKLRVDLDKNEAVPVNPFRQGMRSMSYPTKEWEAMLRDVKMNHGGNPVLAWMNGNVEIERDAADNIKPHKGRSGDKIDGIVAGIMAVAGYLMWLKDNEIHYSEDDLVIL